MNHIPTYIRILIGLAVACALLSCTRKSAPKSLAEALVTVKQIMGKESPSESELKQAEALLFPLANSGDLTAIGALGQLYVSQPKHFPDQQPAGIHMLRKSALAGNGVSAIQLSMAYARGRSVLSNQKEALRWARLSAWQGYDLGMEYYATFLEEGEVIEKDAVSALAWRMIAATRGEEFGLTCPPETGVA